jgi:threonylcarbamoyladenosine tRNA methylthiotransferase MtaB
MRVAFHTFGCKLNQYETESLASSFRNEGYSLVATDSTAELYLVNTCTVTSKSEQKARRLIRGLSRRHPKALIVVTGCYAQLEPDELAGLGGNVRVVPQELKYRLHELAGFLRRDGGQGRERLADLAASGSGVYGTSLQGNPLYNDRPPEPESSFRFHVDRFNYHSRAFLKVQDGCDYRCSYCRVPLARGGSVSLEPAEALRRAMELESGGYRELVLTGVNLGAYRHGEVGLSGLLELLLDRTETLRLRLSSLEPEQVTPHLVRILRDDRIRPHFHLPVQSGSAAVLLRMRRRYRPVQVVRAVKLLREAKGDPFLAADIMVGFPGESEQDFLATRRLIEELQFSRLHVFPFSPRPGTAAPGLSGRVAERIRDERVKKLLGLSDSLRDRYQRRWVGRKVEVILEKRLSRGGEGPVQGLSENYLKVAVHGLPGGCFRRGSPVQVLIEEAGVPCRGRYTGDA